MASQVLHMVGVGRLSPPLLVHLGGWAESPTPAIRRFERGDTLPTASWAGTSLGAPPPGSQREGRGGAAYLYGVFGVGG